jgi:hypothetical protein
MSMFWTRRDKMIRQVAIAASFVRKLMSRRAASTDQEIVPLRLRLLARRNSRSRPCPRLAQLRNNRFN